MTESLIVQDGTPIPVPATVAEEKTVLVTASDPAGGDIVLIYADRPVFEYGEEGVSTLKQGESVTINSRHWFCQQSNEDSCAVQIFTKED